MAKATARDIFAGDVMETGGSLVSSGSEDEQSEAAFSSQRLRFGGKRGLVLAAVAVVLAVAAVAGVARRAAPRDDDTESAVQLFGIAALATAASVLQSGSSLVGDVQSTQGELTNQTNTLFKPLLDLKAQVNAHPGVSQLKVNLTKMNNLSRQELMHPEEDRHDGNVCPDDEELHADLCYKKCSLLTQGQYPIRTTAFGCCMEQPCSFFNTKFTSSFKYCTGFDTNGDAEGNGCPHAAGGCMPNEEFNLGVCYKKCAILTNNTFPFRSAASTCCRYNNHLACIDALNTISNPAFQVGGGSGNGRHGWASTNMTHPPLQGLTESHVPTNVDVGAYVAATTPPPPASAFTPSPTVAAPAVAAPLTA